MASTSRQRVSSGSTSQRGVTLVELLVATGILISGVLAVSGALSSTIIGTRNSQDITRMASSIRQKMEQLRSEDYTDLASGSDYLNEDGEVVSSSSDAFYTRTWTVTPNSPGTGLTEITVTAVVTRTMGEMAPIQLSVRSYRAP